MFKKSQKSGRGVARCVLWSIMSLAVLGLLANEAKAGIIFFDDFEDSDLNGWLTSWQQGQWGQATGLWDVVFHNGSNMARVQHKTDGFHSLTKNFTYMDDSILSFDMQISGQIDGSNHAGGNVTVSFLNKFNVKLGSVSLGYSTNPALIDPAYRVDSDLHHYSASMSEWAEFAGLGSTDNVSTLSLSFVAWGQQYSWLQAGSTGTVWFDNVKVQVIPEPATLSLLSFGGLCLLKRRK